ncbi:MAG: hypothetical protein IDH49_12755 [Gammaproteobacteria bacterium]|nr:hypothetical protein [Gammaproteobacteria bacterium]
MFEFFLEAVVISFASGAIAGAILALHLKNRHKAAAHKTEDLLHSE